MKLVKRVGSVLLSLLSVVFEEKYSFIKLWSFHEGNGYWKDFYLCTKGESVDGSGSVTTHIEMLNVYRGADVGGTCAYVELNGDQAEILGGDIVLEEAMSTNYFGRECAKERRMK